MTKLNLIDKNRNKFIQPCKARRCAPLKVFNSRGTAEQHHYYYQYSIGLHIAILQPTQ
jgi:hypothetical protein